MSRNFTESHQQRKKKNTSSSTRGAEAADNKIDLNNYELFPVLSKTQTCNNQPISASADMNVSQPSDNRKVASARAAPKKNNNKMVTERLVLPITTYQKDPVNEPTEVERPKTRKEELVIDELCKIILKIHGRQEFVSVQHVERELFKQFNVSSFHELGVDQRNLTPLVNLIQRHKSVKLYLQVFEKVFNLCTLHDLGPMLARYLKLNTYDEAHMGPLDQHPDIKRIFQYKRPTSGKAITEITTGDVINDFLDFQANYHGPTRMPFDEFIDDLVQDYQLDSREELGIFCRSFPYLTQVTRKLINEHRVHNRQAELDARSNIIKMAQKRFAKLIEELENVLKTTLDPKTKSPTYIFDHLISIIEKYLVISEQKIVQDTLNKFRKDELLQCLFNVSICLGAMKQPEELMMELKKLYQYPIVNTVQPTTVQASPLVFNNQNKQYLLIQPNPLNFVQNAVMRTTVDTSFESTFLTLPSSKGKGAIMPMKRAQVNYKELCVALGQYLKRYDSILTVKQWSDVEKTFCSQYGIENFFEFGMINENEGGSHPLSLTSFLDLNRERIDPNGQLSIYENAMPASNRRELYAFVKQLLRNDETQNGDQNSNESTDNSTNRPICLSEDQLSAIEKGVKHKFGSLLGFQGPKQIISKANQQHKTTSSMIYFEESLLDIVSLNRLDMSPIASSVDETKLCQLILQCPIMTDLNVWLQWVPFFQPKYGPLKTFIKRKNTELESLLLLETSTHELFRLPNESSLTHFEQELAQMNIRSAVGHLCTSIILEHIHVNRLPFSIYRQVMHTWFVLLQSSATFEHERNEPMEYILEFLTYLPETIGQTLVVQELVLAPLDDVFRIENNEKKFINNREKLWSLANEKQKNKLELWGHLLNVNEWKNTMKWTGQKQTQSESTKKPSIQKLNITQFTITGNVQTDRVEKSTEPVSSTVATQKHVINDDEKRIKSENDSIQSAFEHIESIRRGFGVNAGLDSSGQSIISNLQGMIERSLEKLSNDLYSEQGHFVLEIIQNADDNQYSSDRLPTLRFILSSERILVCNNEIGFRPMHISAICNVGASTKGKHKQGYAGHKGIGFKSVFMISYCPEIYSGAYQFCFDTMNGTQQIGYIRPIWLDQPSEILPSNNEWITCIRLPIKPDRRGDGVQRNFEDIQPILLLFLNRLRRIEIIREQDNEIISMSSFTRIDHVEGKIIELQEQTISTEVMIKHFWLVIKKVIHVPTDIKTKLSEVKCDVESTTIAIAYPLNPINEFSSRQILPTQPLFAYLPLRSYGFRFILQADFEITAARQEVLRDNRWNDWLKSEIVQLFPLAYEQFQNLPDLVTESTLDFQQTNNPLTKIKALKYFLKLIPMRNEIDPYFNTFVDKSIQGLMGLIRLPVFCHEDEQTIDWVLPTQCVIARDSFIRKIFSQNLLLSHFNSYYLHEEFLKDCDEQILLKLGCRRLDFADILKLIRTLYKQNDQIHSTKTTSIEQIAQWLLCIDYSLQQQREQPMFNNDLDEDTESTTMAKLKELKIIPLRHQTRLVSFDEFNNRAILFPPDKKLKYEKYLQIIFDDLPTIDDRLLEYIDDKHPARLDSVKKLLTTLGLCDARNIQRIYANHIVPIILDDSQWSKKSDSTLISYLISIYKGIYALNPEMFEYEMEKLKKMMIIKTSNNKFVRLGSEKIIVHLTSLYGCSQSLEYLKLPNHQFTFISNDYILEYQKEFFHQDSEKRRFLPFLNQLGMTDFFQMIHIDRRFASVDQLDGSPWAQEKQSLSELIHEPFIINDWYSDEFDALISSKENNFNQCAQILLYLHQHHKSISMYYAASVVRSRLRLINTSSEKAVDSSFLRSIRQHAWIPVVGGKLFKPADVYCLNPKDSFLRYVPHIDLTAIPLKDADFMFHILELKKEITPMTMFELFMNWSCNLDREILHKIILQHQDLPTNEPIPCILTRIRRQSCLDKLENIRQIYQMMIKNDQTRVYLTRFRLWPLIFIPRTNDMGDFLYVDEVIWNDPHSLLESTNNIMTSQQSTHQYTLIKPYYGQISALETFFINLLKVKQEPTLEDYLPLLSNVQNKKKDYIWRCIDVITNLAFTQNNQKLVRDKCAEWAFIPCFNTRNEYYKYSDSIFYPTDLDIARLFTDTLLIINPSDRICTPILKNMFCSMFEIRNLSDVIQIHANGDNEHPSIEWTNFYSHIIDLIQLFLIKKNSLSETRSNYFQSIFAQMKIVLVDQIHFSYSYNNSEGRKLTSPKTICLSYIEESTEKFFILNTIETSTKHFNTLVNYLTDNEVLRQKLISFINLLYQKYIEKGEQCFLNERQNFPSQLDTGKWIIPLIKKESELLLLLQKEEEENDDDEQQQQRGNTHNTSDKISDEAISKMKKEPSCFPMKIQPQKIQGEVEEKQLTCFPENPGTINLNMPSQEKDVQTHTVPKEKHSTSTEPKPPTTVSSSQSTASTTNSNTKSENNQDEKKTTNVEQHENATKPGSSDSKKSTDEQIQSENNPTKINTNQKPTEGEILSNKNVVNQNMTSTQPMPAVFKQIHVSTIQGFKLSASNVLPIEKNASSNTTEDDIRTGRCGEDFVFRYLQWKYPDAKIEWVNQDKESQLPYDIRLVHGKKNKGTEYIEVKTTRSNNQNTFQISIAEVEYLLEHPKNYSIYRIYYADDEISSTITILDQVKVHLKQKHLAMSMTIMPQTIEN